MKKLFVAGCSFSDYTGVDHVYGEFLATKLNYEYIHEGAGCGSNWRTWRTITNHVLSGNLTSDDLLIIQYTAMTRNEFWTVLNQPIESIRNSDYSHAAQRKFIDFRSQNRNITWVPLVDTGPDSGHIIRYKIGAEKWQNNKQECEFFEMYEKYFVNGHFCKEQFKIQHYMFQTMLIRNNIKTVFTNSYRQGCGLFMCLPEFTPYMFTDPLPYSDCMQYDLNSGDMGHLNLNGHEIYANWLYSHITSCDWS